MHARCKRSVCVCVRERERERERETQGTIGKLTGVSLSLSLSLKVSRICAVALKYIQIVHLHQQLSLLATKSCHCASEITGTIFFWIADIVSELSFYVLN